MVEAASQLGTQMLADDGTSAKDLKQKPFSSKSNGRRKIQYVSWDAMRSADAELEAKVWELAQLYGYSR